MGMLSSSVKKIEGFRFESFPANRVLSNIVKVFRTDHCCYMQCKNGNLLTNGEMGGKVCYCGTASDYHAIKALKAFGLITAQEAYDHGEYKRAADLNSARYRAAFDTCEILKKAGIRLTKRQREQLADLKAKIDTQRLPWYIKLTDDQKKDIAAAKAKQGK